MIVHVKCKDMYDLTLERIIFHSHPIHVHLLTL